MNFYERMLQRAKSAVIRAEVQMETVEIHLKAGELLPHMLDAIFDDFCRESGWPRMALMFIDPNRPGQFRFRPSDAVTQLAGGTLQGKAEFLCGSKRVVQGFSLNLIDNDQYEFQVGPESVRFNLAQLETAQSLPSMNVAVLLCTRLIMSVLEHEF